MSLGRKRIFGVETEFGCLVTEDNLGRPEEVVEAIKNHLFWEMRVGALDYFSRDDVFEPAGSGGFLLNGGRMYVDAVGSHLEYASAECSTVKELVANNRAGQRMIVQAIQELGWQNAISIYNNSVDHYGGHTFGCHENYLVRATHELMDGKLHLLLPFLVTRQIFAGSGRVGGHVLVGSDGPTLEEAARNPVDYIWVSEVYDAIPDDSVVFQLSQRADHILKPLASRVRFNRSIINPKWETLYTHNGATRLHLLFGESNQSEYAECLKIGTTMLAIRACEDGLILPEILVASPVAALKSISRDSTFRWEVPLLDGTSSTAIQVQHYYLEAARKYQDESEETNWILKEWAKTLQGLENDPLGLWEYLDWPLKHKILNQYIELAGSHWGDGALHTVDMEYHNIDPAKSLFHAESEQAAKNSVVSNLDIVLAQTDPPQTTRAKTRAALVEHVLASRESPNYAFDWGAVQLGRNRYVPLEDPFENLEGDITEWGQTL